LSPVTAKCSLPATDRFISSEIILYTYPVCPSLIETIVLKAISLAFKEKLGFIILGNFKHERRSFNIFLLFENKFSVFYGCFLSITSV
jgi:hypothetical protein